MIFATLLLALVPQAGPDPCIINPYDSPNDVVMPYTYCAPKYVPRGCWLSTNWECQGDAIAEYQQRTWGNYEQLEVDCGFAYGVFGALMTKAEAAFNICTALADRDVYAYAECLTDYGLLYESADGLLLDMLADANVGFRDRQAEIEREFYERYCACIHIVCPMNEHFLIFGRPRSRTAWMANFLTFGSSICYHEGFADVRADMLALKHKLRAANALVSGCADTGLIHFTDQALQVFPDAKLIVMVGNQLQWHEWARHHELQYELVAKVEEDFSRTRETLKGRALEVHVDAITESPTARPRKCGTIALDVR